MPLISDINLNAAKFRPDAVSEQTKAFNQHIVDTTAGGPKWWEVGAAEYRSMRARGETSLPAPTLLPDALDIEIPSRDAGRKIPCRLIYPSARKISKERKNCRGVVMHIHGGGWVLGDHQSTDGLLQLYADTGDLAVVSVGYRLAPENPFPKGPEDCYDAAEYLVKNSAAEYGGPLRFVGGESAGGHLSLLVVFHLLKTQPSFKFNGLLLHFGCFDLSELPAARNYAKTLILSTLIMEKFVNAFLPKTTHEQRKHPSISPLFENLEPFRGRLPPAIFTVGTDDPLLDDSVFMGTKWLMAGGEAYVKVYEGACHGFVAFPPSVSKETELALEDTVTFIKESLAKV